MKNKLRKILSLSLTLSLLFQQLGFAQLAAELNIAAHLSRVASSISVEKFRPPHLRYFSYNPLNDNFKVLVDKGDQFSPLTSRGHFPSEAPKAPSQESVPWDNAKLRSETQTLLNYFLVGISLPDSAFWVNLRPDSQDQIIDPYLEKTEVGRIMLEADLELKKDTSRYTSPATPEGREYWNKLYKKAEELYGFDNVTIPTLTRPWIVPGEIIIRESSEPASAYIYKATLKVMLESDYLKASYPQGSAGLSPHYGGEYAFKDTRSKALNDYSTELIKELIIPKLTKEVNSSKRYAPLRQVYYSLILSRWFKQEYRSQKSEDGKQTNSYINLIDTKDLTNLIFPTPWSKTTYFDQYQQSFAKGEYNIQEPVHTPTGQVVRSYFSGGVAMGSSAIQANTFSSAAGNLVDVDPNTVRFTGNSQGIIGASSSMTQASHIFDYPAIYRNYGLSEEEIDLLESTDDPQARFSAVQMTVPGIMNALPISKRGAISLLMKNNYETLERILKNKGKNEKDIILLLAPLKAYVLDNPDPNRRITADDGMVYQVPKEFVGLVFGTSGHRGARGKQVGPWVAAALTQSSCENFAENPEFMGKDKYIIIGGDPRRYNEIYKEEQARIALANGLKVIFVEGVMPTPIASYLVRFGNEVFNLGKNGVIVGVFNDTPSHNKEADDGIKLNPGGSSEGH
ncbi:MAG: hypothetical protein WC469_05990 [Candidatus Omnitrophota bacterium]